MPTARQPLILAIWPTTMPVAPAAPETTTVSPALGWPTSSRPKNAVKPVITNAPQKVVFPQTSNTHGERECLGKFLGAPRPKRPPFSPNQKTPNQGPPFF